MKQSDNIAAAQSLSSNGVQNKFLATAFQVSSRTIKRWNNGVRSPRICPERKLNHEHLKWLRDFVASYPSNTQQQYCENLKHQFNVVVSLATMHRALRGLHITRKVLTRITSKGDARDQQSFVAWINDRPQQHFVAIDEAAVVMPFSPKYGYALKNKRAPLCNDPLSRKRLSLIAALSSKSPHPMYWLLEENIDSSRVKMFVKSLPRAWQQATIILDNASIHKCLAKTQLQVKYLPTYSPQLNPVELYFQNVKANLRRSSARSKEVVHHILEMVGNRISAPNLFKHCFQSERVTCPDKP